MKIWLRTYPVFCDPAGAGWLPCCTNDADGTVNVGDDTTGDVISVQPDGTIQHRPNGTKGAWEVKTNDSQLNVFVYAGTDVIYRVPYRAR